MATSASIEKNTTAGALSFKKTEEQINKLKTKLIPTVAKYTHLQTVIPNILRISKRTKMHIRVTNRT
jgi:hypothetical protein